MKINLLTRVSEDKNFFMDFVIACYHLKNKGYNITIKFIGDIYSKGIAETVQKSAKLLGISEQVVFTGKFAKINEIIERDEYYFNLSIGNFVGYSSIESVTSGLKTLFYNVDDSLQNRESSKFIYINSFDSLCYKLEKIYTDKEKYDKIIRSENKEMINNFYLTVEEEQKLSKIFQ